MLRLVLPCLLIACESATGGQEADSTVDFGTHALTVAADGPVAWLAVAAPGPEEAWFVGGGLTPPAAAVARFDGVLRPEEAPGPHLWWVAAPGPGAVWACGAEGRILRRGADATWVPEPTELPASAVLWGLWGSSPTDLWAVGGTDTPGGPRGVVLRSSGDGQWQRVRDPALPLEDPADEFAGRNLYKVWGAGPDEVYLVGEGGTALRWDGQRFVRLEVDVQEVLFTVHGRPGGPVLAVGGLTEGVAVRLAGDRFVAETIPPSPALNGVFVRPDGSALATGAQGVVLERDASGRWHRLRAPDTTIGGRTLHAVAVAGGTTWAVGGDLARLTDGVLATDRRPLPAWEAP